jgi:hypothetical protein
MDVKVQYVNPEGRKGEHPKPKFCRMTHLAAVLAGEDTTVLEGEGSRSGLVLGFSSCSLCISESLSSGRSSSSPSSSSLSSDEACGMNSYGSLDAQIVFTHTAKICI